jgi:hypothetical protein
MQSGLRVLGRQGGMTGHNQDHSKDETIHRTGDAQAPGSAPRVPAARRRPPGDGCPAGHFPPLVSPSRMGSRSGSRASALSPRLWLSRRGTPGEGAPRQPRWPARRCHSWHTHYGMGVCEHTPDVGRHGPWYSVTQRGAQDSAPPWQPLACPYPPEGRGAAASASSSSYMPAR